MHLFRGALGLTATLLGLAGCATPSTTTGAPPVPASSAAATDEDLATARAACAAVAAGAEHERCIEFQVRRARGARNTY